MVNKILFARLIAKSESEIITMTISIFSAVYPLETYSTMVDGKSAESGLNNTTYEQNKIYFNPPESMPRRAYTAGVGTVLDAKKVLQLITGERKAAIAAAAIEGPMTAMISSSALQLHPDTVIILDEAAAADLKLKDFYKEVFENDPKWAAYR